MAGGRLVFGGPTFQFSGFSFQFFGLLDHAPMVVVVRKATRNPPHAAGQFPLSARLFR